MDKRIIIDSPSKGSQKEFDFNLVLDQNTQILLLITIGDSENQIIRDDRIKKSWHELEDESYACLQSRWGQIRVFVFELAVEGKAPFVLVIGQQRCQLVDLVEGGTGPDGETISAIVIVINDPYK